MSAADVLKQLKLMLHWFKLYVHLPLKLFGCPSCVWLHSSPHNVAAVLTFFFFLLYLLKCKNLASLPIFNSVWKYHYWFWYWYCLIMDGNESCPQAENAFKKEFKSLTIRAPWEAIISQAGCVVWSWRLFVLQFFMFPFVELSHIHFSFVW